MAQQGWCASCAANCPMREAIVLDASAFIDAITDVGPRGDELRSVLESTSRWIVPELFDLECIAACRRLPSGTGRDVRQAKVVAALGVSLLDRVETWEFLPRIVQLLPNVTTFDAAYVVTAEAYGVPLLTSDQRLSRATGPRCEFLVV
jgi:predicted nucleic acid-binding protein